MRSLFGNLSGRNNLQNVLNESQLANETTRLMEQTYVTGENGDRKFVDDLGRWRETLGTTGMTHDT